MIKHVLPTFLQKRGRYFLFLTGSLLLACLFAMPRQADALVADPQFSVNRSMVHNITLALTQTNTIYMPLAANRVPDVVTPPEGAATQPAATATQSVITATQPAPTATQPAFAEWQPHIYYEVGTQVTYNGAIYRCRQTHTSLPGWEPPNTPTLWQLVSGIGPTTTPTSAMPTPTATARATTTAPTATPRATTTTPTATPANQTPVPTVAGNWPRYVFAPYVDVTLSTGSSMAGLATTLGQKYFTLAFIINGGTCKASWGGTISTSQGFMLDDINNLRALGGDAVPAFGGAAGVELAQSCTTVEALQAQYQAIIDNYNFTALDFDIEGGAIGDTVSITRRNQAIAGLQAAAARAGKPLRISYTLPVDTLGLTYHGVNLLKDAVRNGVDIAMVNIMTMDYGLSGPPDKMAQNVISSANSLLAQLKTIYPTRTDAQLWAMIGLTPMIGLNDTQPGVFSLDDARAVLAFAQEKQIGMLAMWSVGRDQQCADTPTVSPICSGITQGRWDFLKIFKPFTQ